MAISNDVSVYPFYIVENYMHEDQVLSHMRLVANTIILLQIIHLARGFG